MKWASLCLNPHMHGRVDFVYMCPCLWTYTCTYEYRGQRMTSGVITVHFICWDRVSHRLWPHSFDYVGSSTSKSHKAACVCLLSSEVQACATASIFKVDVLFLTVNLISRSKISSSKCLLFLCRSVAHTPRASPSGWFLCCLWKGLFAYILAAGGED